MSHEMMELRQAARHLHMEENELRHFAQRGEVPSVMRGDSFFFEHRLLDEWAQRRLMGLRPKKLTGEHRLAMDERRRAQGTDLRVAQLLVREAIHPEITAKNRGGVLRDMTDLAEATGLVYDPDALFRELVEREAIASTAVGEGAAFLHPRFHDPYLFSDSFIAYGRSERPVFFGAADGQGTRHFFLICSTDHDLHLRILARLAVMTHATEFLGRLDGAVSAEEVVATVREAEEGLL